MRAFEILNQPISWWTGQPGFETLLAAMKLKPISPMPIPNSDQIDKFFDADQRRAIVAALDHRRPFVVIHGQRGSGKTLVAAEIISKVIILIGNLLVFENFFCTTKFKVLTNYSCTT